MRSVVLDLASSGLDQTRWAGALPGELDTADLVVWHSAAVAACFAPALERSEPRVLTPAASDALLGGARRRREAFARVLSGGGLLVVLLSERACFGVHTLQEVVAFDPLEAIPGCAARVDASAGGEPLHVVAGEPFAGFLAEVGAHLRPTATLTGVAGTVIARDPASRRPVAAHWRAGGGQVLVLPEPATGGSPTVGQALFDAIARLARRLRDPEAAALPDWAHAPLWPQEARLHARREQARRRHAALLAQTDRLSRDLGGFLPYKAVLGAEPERALAAVARLLGALGYVTDSRDADGVPLVVVETSTKDVVLAALAERDAGRTGERVEAVIAAVSQYRRDLAVASGFPAGAVLIDLREQHVPPGQRAGPGRHECERASVAGVDLVGSAEVCEILRTRDPAALAAFFRVGA